MKRKKTLKRVDRKVFKNTALRTKALNVPRTVMRGGIRM